MGGRDADGQGGDEVECADGFVDVVRMVGSEGISGIGGVAVGDLDNLGFEMVSIGEEWDVNDDKR